MREGKPRARSEQVGVRRTRSRSRHDCCRGVHHVLLAARRVDDLCFDRDLELCDVNFNHRVDGDHHAGRFGSPRSRAREYGRRSDCFY